MTKIKNNPIMKGASGMLAGTVVYRQYRGKTVMSNRPKRRAIMTPHQQSIKSRFLQAVQYAKKVISDPALKAKYQPGPGSEFTSAYIAALADYLRRLKAGDTSLPDTGNPTDRGENTAVAFGDKIIHDGQATTANINTVANLTPCSNPTGNHILADWIGLSRRLLNFLTKAPPDMQRKYRMPDLFTTRIVQL